MTWAGLASVVGLSARNDPQLRPERAQLPLLQSGSTVPRAGPASNFLRASQFPECYRAHDHRAPSEEGRAIPVTLH